MPDPGVITELGRAFVGDVPLFLQDQQDVVAVLHAQAVEHERLTQRIGSLAAEFLPSKATAVGLPLLEALVNTTISPEGLTDAERRTLLVGYFGRLQATPEGSNWIATIDRIVGPGWTYREHNPDDPSSSPPPLTVLVTLPFPPDSDLYGRMRSLIRDVTPAHLGLIVNSAAGFALDRSGLDIDTL